MRRPFLGAFLGSLLQPLITRATRRAAGPLVLAVLVAGAWLVQWFLEKPWWLRLLLILGAVALMLWRFRPTAPLAVTPRPEREPIPDWLRRQVIARDDGVCGICGFRVRAGEEHIDHIHPVHAGGTNDPGNLQTAHVECNLRKGGIVGWQPPYRREAS